MAAKVWYATNNKASVHKELSETTPGADATASPVTGWIVGTGATLQSAMFDQVERAASTFADSVPPDGTPDATNGDCLRTAITYSGDFANANWTVQTGWIAVTNGGAQDGRMRCRLLRGANADGSGATEITAAQQQGGLVTNLATSAQQTSTATFNPGAFTVTNEYIFVQLGWERTGAGGMTTADVDMRIGTTASLITSADFTPVAPTGTGAISVPSATVAGTGAEVFTATGAVSVSAPTVAGTGAEVFTATGAVTVPAPTVAGTGEEAFTATGAISIPAPTVEGVGDHTGGAPTHTGTGAISVPAATVAGTGALVLTATGAISVPSVTVAGVGELLFTATGAIVMPAAVVNGTGSLILTGTGAIAVPSVLVAGSGLSIEPISGTGVIGIPAPMVVGVGVHGSEVNVGPGPDVRSIRSPLPRNTGRHDKPALHL